MKPGKTFSPFTQSPVFLNRKRQNKKLVVSLVDNRERD